MKICIIGNGFSGATLPLAHHLNEKDYNVECFYFVKYNSTSIESLDYPKISIVRKTPIFLNKKNILYNYLNHSINVYLLPLIKRRIRLEKIIVGEAVNLYNNWLIDKYAEYIINKKYDIVNIIIHTPYELRLCRRLQDYGIKIIITFHEVLQNLVSKRELKEVVVQSVKLNVPIILHSQNTLNRLLDLSIDGNLKNRTHVIHFGKFESYLSYGYGKAVKKLHPGYLLYLGHISPYKGLSYLFEATNILSDKENLKIVVAGNGKDPVLEKMKSDSRYVVINRFIENEELVWLIRNCHAIVCPYIAASQSGLVQTSMVFGKPIIATDVGAFQEIVKEGINGCLAKSGDAESLAKAIERSFLIQYSENQIPIGYDWDAITELYINLINKYENC